MKFDNQKLVSTVRLDWGYKYNLRIQKDKIYSLQLITSLMPGKNKTGFRPVSRYPLLINIGLWRDIKCSCQLLSFTLCIMFIKCYIRAKVIYKKTIIYSKNYCVISTHLIFKGGVACISTNESGNLAVTGGRDGKISIWQWGKDHFFHQVHYSWSKSKFILYNTTWFLCQQLIAKQCELIIANFGTTIF